MRFWRTAAGSGAIARNDREAFEADALSFLNHLYAVAVRLTRNPSAAEDLVQDTYLKAFRFAGRFEPGTNLKAWLFSILYNTFRNDKRGLHRNPVDINSPAVDRAGESAGHEESPETALIRRTMDPAVRAALAELPDVFRQAVWLRDVEELSYAEIARALEVPVGTVMSRISRGRRQLHDRLAGTAAAPTAALVASAESRS